MSSEKFENIEEELRSLKDDIQKKIEFRLPKLRGEEKKKLTRELERQIETTHSLLQDLEEEAQLAPYPFRSQLLGKVRQYKDDIKTVENKLQRNVSGFFPQQMPSSGTYGAHDAVANEQRVQVLQTAHVLGQTSESIIRSQRVAAETDIIGNEIITELGQQRESLTRTKERLTDTDINLSKSRKILRSMYRRVITNKLILVLIIIVEAGILGGIVYWKYFHK